MKRGAARRHGDSASVEDVGFARIDHDRTARKGTPEVVFCERKTPDQAAVICARIATRAGRVLATRATPAHAAAIRRAVPAARYHESGRVVVVGGRPRARSRTGYILVTTGGTADLPVAEEAVLTAEFLGAPVRRLYDVGVAGLHRLLSHTPLVRKARVIVAVAGMDGALPGVVAGLAPAPVIAVPTSVGYGTGLGGVAALMNMLNACAPGVAVVNIDNGFGAGYLAAQIAGAISPPSRDGGAAARTTARSAHSARSRRAPAPKPRPSPRAGRGGLRRRSRQ